MVVGPTASGKTAKSIEIARKLGTQIVSADSVQIYRDLDRKCKIKLEQMQGIKHHMIDVVSPFDNYSVSDYRRCEQGD